MSRTNDITLARREREVMDIVYRLGEAGAQEILVEMSNPPTYSAVRALLTTMVEKNLLKHRKDSRRYVYRPAVSEKKAKRSALNNLLATFFDGRPENLVASLLDPSDQKLSDAEIARIRELIDSQPDS